MPRDHAPRREGEGAPQRAPDAPPSLPGVCVLCERGRPFRRRLCRSCHRKLRACGLPLPPMSAPGPRPRPVVVHLVAWLALWSDEQRAALVVATVAAARHRGDPRSPWGSARVACWGGQGEVTAAVRLADLELLTTALGTLREGRCAGVDVTVAGVRLLLRAGGV